MSQPKEQTPPSTVPKVAAEQFFDSEEWCGEDGMEKFLTAYEIVEAHDSGGEPEYGYQDVEANKMREIVGHLTGVRLGADSDLGIDPTRPAVDREAENMEQPVCKHCNLPKVLHNRTRNHEHYLCPGTFQFEPSLPLSIPHKDGRPESAAPRYGMVCEHCDTGVEEGTEHISNGEGTCLVKKLRSVAQPESAVPRVCAQCGSPAAWDVTGKVWRHDISTPALHVRSSFCDRYGYPLEVRPAPVAQPCPHCGGTHLPYHSHCPKSAAWPLSVAAACFSCGGTEYAPNHRIVGPDGETALCKATFHKSVAQPVEAPPRKITFTNLTLIAHGDSNHFKGEPCYICDAAAIPPPSPAVQDNINEAGNGGPDFCGVAVEAQPESVPFTKPLTVILHDASEEAFAQVDSDLAAVRDNSGQVLRTLAGEAYFMRLRRRVTEDRTLLDKVAVFLPARESHGEQQVGFIEVGLRLEDELRWPIGLFQSSLSEEVETREARKAAAVPPPSPSLLRPAIQATAPSKRPEVNLVCGNGHPIDATHIAAFNEVALKRPAVAAPEGYAELLQILRFFVYHCDPLKKSDDAIRGTALYDALVKWAERDQRRDQRAIELQRNADRIGQLAPDGNARTAQVMQAESDATPQEHDSGYAQQAELLEKMILAPGHSRQATIEYLRERDREVIFRSAIERAEKLRKEKP